MKPEFLGNFDDKAMFWARVQLLNDDEIEVRGEVRPSRGSGGRPALEFTIGSASGFC